MDASAIAIAAVGTLLFIGVITWKAVWFVRKMNETEAEAAAKGDGAEPDPRQS